MSRPTEDAIVTEIEERRRAVQARIEELEVVIAGDDREFFPYLAPRGGARAQQGTASLGR
ncbi:MAG: hypothetical protein ACRDOS_11100 [Gaiellaceae bacterium]